MDASVSTPFDRGRGAIATKISGGEPLYATCVHETRCRCACNQESKGPREVLGTEEMALAS